MLRFGILKLWPILLVAALLVLLVTVRTNDRSVSIRNQLREHLRVLRTNQTLVTREVLRTKEGSASTHDTLAIATRECQFRAEQIEQCVVQLGEDERSLLRAELSACLDEIRLLLEHVEQFKTDFAVYRNSIHAVPVLVEQVGLIQESRQDEVFSLCEEFLSLVLLYDHAGKRIGDSLLRSKVAALQEEAKNSDEEVKELVGYIAIHAEKLIEYTPQVDQHISDIMENRSSPHLERMVSICDQQDALAINQGLSQQKTLFVLIGALTTYLAASFWRIQVTANKLNATNSELESRVRDRTRELQNRTDQLEIRTDELELARQIAEESTRAKSTFLANMSHEIRTPMTAILGFADLANSGQLAGDEQKEAIATIQRNGNHLLSIINDILDISKVEAGKLDIELTTLTPLKSLDEVIELFRGRAAEKAVQLELRCEGSIPSAIQTDPTRFRQAIVNLVGNAIKFTDNGRVSLVVSCDPKSEMLTVKVIDTGIGIPEDRLSSIFHAFTQADISTTRKFGGTGLGLTITAKIAELLGGSVEVSSEVGKGTTFVFSVATGRLDGVEFCQVTQERSAAEATPARPAIKENIDGRILLVEDGFDNQQLIKFVLQKAGAEVEIAENGKEGLDAALAAWQNDQAFDVVLMDMQMPVMDGSTATRKLRDAGYPGQVIALTAHAMKGEVDSFLEAGCDGYLSKPIVRDTFLAEVAIRAELSRQQAASSS